MRKIRIIVLAAAVSVLCVFFIFLFWFRGREAVQVSDITFRIQSGTQDAALKLWHNYYDGKEYLFLPSFCTEETACVVGTKNAQSRSWDGQKLSFLGYLKELTDGEHILRVGETEFTVVIMRSAKVPALFVTTASGTLTQIEAEKGNSEAGLYRMVTADGRELANGQLKELKSRGNATFLEDKKPYQMSLEDPEDLLGTGKLKHYILLANRQDQSLLRDRILYDMAADIGVPYSPVSRHVDLYINEEYRGSYQLSEKVEAAENRLPIDVSAGSAEPGFLVSLEYQTPDRLTEDTCYFKTKNNQAVVIKRPKNLSERQKDYIQDVFQNMETAILNGKLEDAGIDAESFAKKYLVEEISKNLDAMHASQYFYKDAGDGAVYAGPVWDYDKTLGNPLIEHTRPVNFQEPKGIYAATRQQNASWWYDLYQIPEFRRLVIREYQNSAIPAIERMLDKKIDAYCEEIWESAYMDYMRWDPFEDFKYERELCFAQEYRAEIEQIKEFLYLRMEFLNDIWLEGRAYHQIVCDADGGEMYVTKLDAVEGRKISEPRAPKKEGYEFAYWIREDNGERYDFEELYAGEAFALKAVYRRAE